MSPAHFITDFADQAVMLPLAVVIAVGMLAAGWLRGALAWSLVISGMLAVMLVLKLWAGTCGEAMFGDQLQSPSGHTASAAAIYGGALSLLLHRTFRGMRMTLICAMVVALLVGISRIVIGAHSIIEVAIGAVVGVAAAMILERTAGPSPKTIRIVPMAAAAFVTMLVFHGLHLPAEAAIRKARVTWLPFGICRV
jgi:membrane-associated phospholipid phosphatase